MTTGPGTSTSATPSCALFEAQLAEWLEGALDDETRRLMERHQDECAACRSIVLDLDAVVQAAGAIPRLSPSRDLWPEIEARLEAPVIPLGARMATAVASSSVGSIGGMSVRRFAAAAAVLVAVSSAVTWRIARVPFQEGAAAVASSPVTPAPQGVAAVPSPDASLATSAAAPVAATAGASAPAPSPGTSGSARPGVAHMAPAASGTAFVAASRDQAIAAVRAASGGDVNVVYEREIAALRQIVDQRFAELDPATVDELQKNLAIIDQAIADSRKALQSDPRSGLLAGQLDRTLEAKLSLMRRVALL